MNPSLKDDANDQPVFEPDDQATYTIDIVEQLTGVSQVTILQYQEMGLLSQRTTDDAHTVRFDDGALRILRRIDYLRTICGINESGLRLILDLMNENEQLQENLRCRK